MKAETLTLVLVNLAGIMERADESLLPGVYKEVGAALHTDPTGLGSLTLFRSIVQSACYPVAAYLAVRHNRAHVIALGAFLWAAATFLVAFSSTFFQVAVSRALNGIGLALVAPAIQSLVADSTDDSNRGMAFGWLLLTGNLGSLIGGLFSVMIAPITFIGIPGWRISFHIVGFISILVGILVYLFANDPHFSNDATNASNQVPNKTFWSEVKDLFQEAKSVSKLSSFQIIVAQGVTGSFPWSALSFAPMWLELTGFSHEKTAFLIALCVIASSVGGLFGGKMGDILSTHFPNSGRIILAQISSASAIPLAAILLLGLSTDPSTVIPHGFVLIIMGFFISWNAPATNNPIFAEIVPERARTSVYALDRSLESILSSFAPPAVGILAQHVYGYKPIPEGSSESHEILTDRENAASLAKSLYTAIGIPMAHEDTIIGLLWDMITAGMDTTVITVEWAMAELVKNPRVQQKAQEELDQVLGFERIMTESDFSSLPYLQCVAKEALRLHPPTPLMLPHRANANVKVGGYDIPKGSNVHVNVWAVARDPAVWKDPLEFRPERFLEEDVDMKGHDFRLLPFGAGRRICPGTQLGINLVVSMLGHLLHHFSWAPPEGVKPEEIDMSENPGLVAYMSTPLQAVATPRLPSHLYKRVPADI